MLVLTRKQGETIVIADNIVVTVLHVEGSAVRLGIVAPPEIHILRGELQQRPALSPAPRRSPVAAGP